MSLYSKIIRPVLFRLDPEWVHDRAIGTSAWAGRIPLPCERLSRAYRVEDVRLNVKAGGILFQRDGRLRQDLERGFPGSTLHGVDLRGAQHCEADQ